MKRLILLVVLGLAVTACRSEATDGAVLELVKAQHGCPTAKIVAKGSGWRALSVCGVRRFYEYGRWCTRCSSSWRERVRTDAPGKSPE
jgi:hypothetical protein